MEYASLIHFCFMIDVEGFVLFTISFASIVILRVLV